MLLQTSTKFTLDIYKEYYNDQSLDYPRSVLSCTAVVSNVTVDQVRSITNASVSNEYRLRRATYRRTTMDRFRIERGPQSQRENPQKASREVRSITNEFHTDRQYCVHVSSISLET
jgi:hypothetical protein